MEDAQWFHHQPCGTVTTFCNVICSLMEGGIRLHDKIRRGVASCYSFRDICEHLSINTEHNHFSNLMILRIFILP